LLKEANSKGTHNGDYFILKQNIEINVAEFPADFVFTGHLDALDHTITLIGTSESRNWLFDGLGDGWASEILNTKTAYVNGVKITGTMPNRGAVDAVIDDISQPYVIPNGYHDGSGTVGIDATEQAKIIPANIRAGVEILGVTGTMSGMEDVVAQTKNVTPYTTAQTIVPDTGYNYLSQVNVAAIPYTETPNAAGGITVTIGEVAPTP
jgi:hypothetical protein